MSFVRLPIDMFKFWGSHEPQPDPTSSRPGPATSSSTQRPGDQSHALSHAEAAGIIVHLNDKSGDELKKLLSDKKAYQEFLLSIDLVKIPNNLRDELRNETLQLARENLAKESCITEQRNQCMIIRTTELASAQDKLNDLNKQKAEILKSYSPPSLLHKLQESMSKTDEESETLHTQLLEKEIDLATFIQKYRKLRMDYHKRALTHIAASTSLTS